MREKVRLRRMITETPAVVRSRDLCDYASRRNRLLETATLLVPCARLSRLPLETEMLSNLAIEAITKISKATALHPVFARCRLNSSLFAADGVLLLLIAEVFSFQLSKASCVR